MTLDGGYTAFPSYSDALSTLYSQSSPGHAHMPILLWVIKEDTCNIIRIAIQIYLSIAFHRCCALLRICNANGFRVHNSRLIESHAGGCLSRLVSSQDMAYPSVRPIAVVYELIDRRTYTVRSPLEHLRAAPSDGVHEPSERRQLRLSDQLRRPAARCGPPVRRRRVWVADADACTVLAARPRT